MLRHHCPESVNLALNVVNKVSIGIYSTMYPPDRVSTLLVIFHVVRRGVRVEERQHAALDAVATRHEAFHANIAQVAPLSHVEAIR